MNIHETSQQIKDIITQPIDHEALICLIREGYKLNRIIKSEEYNRSREHAMMAM